ncbi:TPA: FMN-binding protein MioC [Mannheimia haemolytica]|uniref:FMN-binding protein MioC n=1 Tax=Mannheimia haemolytica TaxID=75985 RepID=A0A378NF33_MANHA|nr:FMN-binding protein MioC [Mannheimia haemolytica]AGQ38905.1 mioC [Mannheimia haemolytica D171]AJE06892.1 FMN-binding protein MioC [Mannheimia haemolytica USDA-ARS-USMARC-184]EEY10084.1 flavodoxin [Mannheimia haemolytica serotype A2 str. OVINE]EEY13718.1 flavodoxin [Mannheimia haemolytica serotype A2 str. BOVINE]EPZ00300.1 mioC [Mannheimia haemolytica D35]
MTSICIITGSTLGGAEYVADHINEVLSEQGFEVELFNQATLADIEGKANLIVVTSTHGAGELPENIQPLFDDLANSTADFSSMKFGVIGLGSSDYDTFCNAVNIVEEALKAKGASQVCESLRIDVMNNFDHDGSAEEWLPSFIEQL